MSKKNDPFEGTLEMKRGYLGPEVWQVTTGWYTVAVRFNNPLKCYMMLAIGTIDGEIFDALQTFKQCPEFNQETKIFLDNAFIDAGKKAHGNVRDLILH